MKYSRQKLYQEIKNYEKEGKTPPYTYVGFWGNKNDSLAERSFSNFYRTNFETQIYDGRTIVFTCSEQYFMYKKALYFKDMDAIEELIVSGLTPMEYKTIGRNVKGYSDTAWSKVRYAFMKETLLLKFTQNSKLQKYLLDTGTAIIVECSGFDRIWGCGLFKQDKITKKNSTAWKDVRNWTGENLLGFCLMEVRDILVEN